MQKPVLLAAAAIAAVLTSHALAHVTLETEKAPADSTYKAVLRVGHGCEGKPTTTLRVKIPEGVIAAKPMPKPGWQLATITRTYEKTYDYFGTPLSEGVTEITWTGGELPDEWYDEFVFRARLAGFAPGTVVYFPVVQECAGGSTAGSRSRARQDRRRLRGTRTRRDHRRAAGALTGRRRRGEGPRVPPEPGHAPPGMRGKSPGRRELTRLRRAGMSPIWFDHVGAEEGPPVRAVARRP
jgi:periplasmic copper chaperone A